ncbi:hypothetical protein LIER_19818 [Lithospermum erythrorhizon]|uniref:Uncharacterized protein n=1 Tax=Lithospermum erythrorhizon TaxID=34254 RepID=A0AAV3QJ24_LITER
MESVVNERDVAVKEKDVFCADRDEMLQTHDCLLDQLLESIRQTQVLEATLKGIRSTDRLEVLVQNSDVGRDLLFRHSSRALERTIQVVQSKMDKAELEVPASFWDQVRDSTSSPCPT